jgi:hypothetical protein
MVRLIKLRVVRNDVKDENAKKGKKAEGVKFGAIKARALRSVEVCGQRLLNQGRCANLHR